MQHVAFEHIRDRLETTVGVWRKSCHVFIWAVAAEFIQHQKRINPCMRTLAKAAIERDPRTIRRAGRPNYLL